MADGQSEEIQGTDLRSAATAIEGLLNDDGDTGGRPSRAHPDFDHDTDDRVSPQQRDERGRFQKKAATPANDDETVVEEVDVDAEDDQLAASDELTEDTVDDGDTDEIQATPDVDEADDAEPETGRIETVAELAEALEMTVEDVLQGLTHQFRAADSDVTVTLADAIAGYQKDADYRKGTAENAEWRRKAEADYTQRMQAFDQQHHFLASHLNATEQMIAAELNDPKLAILRDSNPAEWNARRTEIGEKLAQVQHARSEAAASYDQFKQQQLLELKDREFGQLKERMPDFSTQHADRARKTMESIGYQPDEIKQVFDHRLVLAALELASLRDEVTTLRAEKAKAKETTKRVTKEIPKLQKPGRKQAQPKGAVRRDNIAKLQSRLKKSGRVDDAAALIAEQLNL